jgi:glycogen debranching enzyme
MTHEEHTTGPGGDTRQDLSPQEQQDRKQRVLAQGTPSIARSIAHAVVAKDGDIYFLTEPDGTVPLDRQHGFGLYYHDCRFLNGYTLRLGETKPHVLASSETRGYMTVFQLTNTDLHTPDGMFIPKESIGIKWERVIDATVQTLYDVLTFENFGLRPVVLPLALTFHAGFEDVFAVRGLLPERLGQLWPAAWTDGRLSLGYDGSDGLYRSVTIRFIPQPDATDATTARFTVTLQPEESKQILISLALAEARDRQCVQSTPQHEQPDLHQVQAYLQASADEWLGDHTHITSESVLLNMVLHRSLLDLRALRSTLAGRRFFAAGVPWFVTLFGRDSLIAALQTLAYDPRMAEETLRLLATYQGQRVDAYRDEQPGKILHELRVGEMANTGEIPHSPYYGTVDATLLFLILLGRHASWTGSLAVFHDLREHVEQALAWMATYGDLNGDGYMAYQSASEHGLINQGWKDSGDAIVNADGSLATPPIALVELQGYAYLARLTVAELYRRAGESARADQLAQEAQALRRRFNRDFWLADKGIYALALQAEHQPCAVVSSNPGHALWAGIADPEKAQRTAQRLMADDMFNGWGIRTLADSERRYNPIGYHLGTVWPHDNAIIAAGFRRYGYDDAFGRVFAGIVEAAMHFSAYRLPELFAGFQREEYGIPVHYPVACHPQAWAAGAVPYLVETALGLVPEAFEHRLRIVRPVLPAFIDRLEVQRLRVGQARVHLHFERTSSGIAVQVLECAGDLSVVIEPRGPLP